MKFKEGDKIRAKKDLPRGVIPKGHILTIGGLYNDGLSNDEDAPYFYTNQDTSVYDTSWAWYRSEVNDLFELVEENPLQEFVENIVKSYKDMYEFPLDYKPVKIIQIPATKKTTMSKLITTFKNITRSEPNKTFVKAGVMNEDLALTEDGKELFIQFMFDKHASEFKKEVVDAIVAEQEKK